MVMMWLRQAFFLTLTWLALFLAYCLAALLAFLSRLRQRRLRL
jgi:hypothetical protein